MGRRFGGLLAEGPDCDELGTTAVEVGLVDGVGHGAEQESGPFLESIGDGGAVVSPARSSR